VTDTEPFALLVLLAAAVGLVVVLSNPPRRFVVYLAQ